MELVRRARHGDWSCFHGLVDRHAAYLYGLAVSLVGDANDAEDLVQETLAGAFRGLGTFGERSSVKTWLTRILVRQAARHFRRRKVRLAGLIGLARRKESKASPAASRSDVQMDVQAAIMALQPEHREVIVLREMQSLAYEEISQVLGVPAGTVESRLFRARRALRELLREYLT